MISYYLASRYSRRTEMRRYRKQLQQAGHSVTSRWLDKDCEEDADTAVRDLVDVESADCVILFAILAIG